MFREIVPGASQWSKAAPLQSAGRSRPHNLSSVICDSVLVGASRLTPFVPWIFALQFQFQLGIGLPPKRREFLGDLNGTIVRSEHVYKH